MSTSLSQFISDLALSIESKYYRNRGKRGRRSGFVQNGV